MSHPFAALDAETLLARKDSQVLALARLLARLGLEPDYAVTVMAAARGLAAEDRLAVLEALVEIEAIKYTLAARRVRELEEGARRACELEEGE